jgi:hypothetical protein
VQCANDDNILKIFYVPALIYNNIPHGVAVNWWFASVGIGMLQFGVPELVRERMQIL